MLYIRHIPTRKKTHTVLRLQQSKNVCFWCGYKFFGRMSFNLGLNGNTQNLNLILLYYLRNTQQQSTYNDVGDEKDKNKVNFLRCTC